MIALLLQAAPAQSPSTPWQATLAATLAIALINAAGLVLVARAQRAKKKPAEKPPEDLAPLRATVAQHERRITDIEGTLAEETDPSVRKRDTERTEARVSKIEQHIAEVEREARLSDRARHEADAKMQAALARIEGYLQGKGESR